MSRPAAARPSGIDCSPGTAGWPWGAMLALLVAAAYSPTFSAGFVWDDDDYVQNNVALRSLAGLHDIWTRIGTVPQYYPLTHTTFWVEWHLWGLDPRGYHAVNVALHAVAVVLAWRVLLGLRVPGAWFAAALFAVHPVSVESVAWITERKNVLSCALALGALLAYLRFLETAEPATSRQAEWPKPSRRTWYFVALLLFLAALLSKTVVVSLPAVLLLLIWWRYGQLSLRDFLDLAPFFLLGIALAGLTIWMEKSVVGANGQEWELTPLARLLLAGRAFWFYLGKLLWPRPLIFFYPRWEIDTAAAWQYLFPAAGLFLVVALFRTALRWGRGPVVAVLVFAGVLAPALGFFDVYPFRYSFVADHFQYHACLAIFALAAAVGIAGGQRVAGHTSWLPRATAVVLLLGLGLVTFDRNRIFADRTTLLETTFQQNPQAWVAPQDLGSERFQRGEFAAAIAYQTQALACLQELNSRAPTDPRIAELLAGSYALLGYSRQSAGQLAGAEDCFRAAIALRERLISDDPQRTAVREGLASCQIDLALVLQTKGDLGAATAACQQAIEHQRILVDAAPQAAHCRERLAGSLVNLGLIQRAAQKPVAAVQAIEAARALRAQLVREVPEEEQYQDGLAWCCTDLGLIGQDSGNFAAAIDWHRRAITIREALVADRGDSVPYLRNLAAATEDLAIALSQSGKADDAAVAHRRAIALRERERSITGSRGDPPAALAWNYERLAEIDSGCGQVDQAIRSLVTAASLRCERLVPVNPSPGDVAAYRAVTGRLAQLLESAGRTTAAQAVYEQQVAELTRVQAENPLAVSAEELAQSLDLLAQAAERAGDLPGAKTARGRSAEIRAGRSTD